MSEFLYHEFFDAIQNVSWKLISRKKVWVGNTDWVCTFLWEVEVAFYSLDSWVYLEIRNFFLDFFRIIQRVLWKLVKIKIYTTFFWETLNLDFCNSIVKINFHLVHPLVPYEPYLWIYSCALWYMKEYSNMHKILGLQLNWGRKIMLLQNRHLLLLYNDLNLNSF